MGEPHNPEPPNAFDLRSDLDALYDAVDALKAKIEKTDQKGENVTSNMKEYNRTYQRAFRAGRRDGLKILRHDPKVMDITHKQFLDKIQNAPTEDLPFLEALLDLADRRIKQLQRRSKN